jgi:hypothetical protein
MAVPVLAGGALRARCGEIKRNTAAEMLMALEGEPPVMA